MESENTALVYLICLLLKEDVRPGYIPNIDFIFYIKYINTSYYVFYTYIFYESHFRLS
jgi:hypothetical protein